MGKRPGVAATYRLLQSSRPLAAGGAPASGGSSVGAGPPDGNGTAQLQGTAATNTTVPSFGCAGCSGLLQNSSTSSSAAASLLVPMEEDGGSSGGGATVLLLVMFLAVAVASLFYAHRRRIRLPWSARQPCFSNGVTDVQLTANLGDWMAAGNDEDDVTIGGPLSTRRSGQACAGSAYGAFQSPSKDEDVAYHDLSTPR
mmetsp:Transcript_22661/g.51792  ORF Transcript_22661/g.51792 Transcript_22661/m.51792 type:complete len:199 (+) Transcript_22661:1-597(+)